LSDDRKPYGGHSRIIVLVFDYEYDESYEILEEYGVFELDGLYIPSEEGML
jgi:hypothetical protein